MDPAPYSRKPRLVNRWRISPLVWLVTALASALMSLIVASFLMRQLDAKGCAMAYMRPTYTRLSDFDQRYTRLADRYSLYIYREAVIDDDTRVQGVPVLFIPGNAGSYRQVRSWAAESAVYFHDVLANDGVSIANGMQPFDFFSADFEEEFTAFHGRTLLDQAEYLNDAIAFILQRYRDPNTSRRDPQLPLPTSVILVGHSMGGVVARTLFTLPNYRPDTVDTIVTLAAPHARAPVSFDGDMILNYEKVNTFWREAFTRESALDNPLSNVTLVSIAGGSLDTIVPSDYSTVSSVVPQSHGFTVFTSSIATVWTSMDHLAITWCDQLRKRAIRALYQVVDARRPSQTKNQAERMAVLQKYLLTGLEDAVERPVRHSEGRILLTTSKSAETILGEGDRLRMSGLGLKGRPDVTLMPVPSHNPANPVNFALLTYQPLVDKGHSSRVQVLLCGMSQGDEAQASMQFKETPDFSGGSDDASRRICVDAAPDVVQLPASRLDYQDSLSIATGHTFSYLQYSQRDLGDYDAIAVIDWAERHEPGWVVAEYMSSMQSNIDTDASLSMLLYKGINVTLGPDRSLMTHIRLPAVQSSLLAYHLRTSGNECPGRDDLFVPLLRQYVDNPYESKYYLDTRDVEISLHGAAPYLPPSLPGRSSNQALSLQLWLDPNCGRHVSISLSLDIVGSLGKLWMRYRTIFATLPLVIVSLALRKQFQLYDERGVFVSFTEALDKCMRLSVPLTLAGLSLLSILYRQVSANMASVTGKQDGRGLYTDYSQNDLLLGSEDVFFWFLIPAFGLVSVGLCVVLNHMILLITSILARISVFLTRRRLSRDKNINTVRSFATVSVRHWLFMAVVLLLLTAVFVPYQVVYTLLCLVQLVTCARALGLAKSNNTARNGSFYNYTHSMLLLLLWILPINLPVLVIWIRRLAIQWSAPFPSHHNVMAVLPIAMLVASMDAGTMPVRVQSPFRHITQVSLLGMAVFAAIYGVSFAYRLHWAAAMLCNWLISLHLWTFIESNSDRGFVDMPNENQVGAGESIVLADAKKLP